MRELPDVSPEEFTFLVEKLELLLGPTAKTFCEEHNIPTFIAITALQNVRDDFLIESALTYIEKEAETQDDRTCYRGPSSQ